MRPINNFEREILRRIIHYHNNGIVPNVASIIDPNLSNKDLFLDYANNTVEIRIDQHFYNNGTLVDEVRTLTLEIVTVINLLKDLQDNGYVALFLEAPLPVPPTPTARYGQLIVGHTFISAAINDPIITSLLLDYSFKTILVGQPLIDFVNNNFRRDEQVAADRESAINRRNLSIAVIALVLSTLLSFWEIYNGTQEVKYGKMQVEQEQNVKLNTEQDSAIQSTLNQNNVHLDSINSLLRQIRDIQQTKPTNKASSAKGKQTNR